MQDGVDDSETHRFCFLLVCFNSIPMTDYKFSELLATGSVLTNNLNRLFVMPEPYDERESNTLKLVGSAFEALTDDEFADIGSNYDLVFLEGEDLIVNVGDYDGLLADADITICNFAISTNPADSAAFATALRDGINGACSGFAGEVDDCTFDDSTETFSGCSFKVVVGVSDDDAVFIYTVDDGSTENNLLGLLQAVDTSKNPATPNAPLTLAGLPSKH